MLVDVLLWVSLLSYSVGWGTNFSILQKKVNLPPHFGIRSLQLGTLIHLGLLIYLLTQSQWPRTLVPDFLILIAWVPVLFYLLTRKYIHNQISAAGMPLFTIVLLAVSAGLIHLNIPTVESIQEARLLYQTLLITHISTMIAGYILFGLSSASSVLFLYQEHQIKTKLVKLLVRQFPSLSALDQISYRSVILGFIFLTLGLVLGVLLSDGLQSIRSIFRVGITLLIWLLYAFFLVERIFQGSARRFSAIWSVLGFFLVLTSLIVESFHLI